MTIEQINAMPQREFIDSIGWVFEHSPWVAERAWQARPFGSLDELHRAMAQAVERASRAEQLALVRAHPELRTFVEGNESLAPPAPGRAGAVREDRHG